MYICLRADKESCTITRDQTSERDKESDFVIVFYVTEFSSCPTLSMYENNEIEFGVRNFEVPNFALALDSLTQLIFLLIVSC